MDGKRRVMFVDDEQRVLEGLRRMLRPLKDEWEMTFCTGGEDALRHLAEQPVDVVVSDIRMPRMDGVQLFNEIVRLHPRTVRIALSGQTSEEAMLRAVGTVHQFLSKPCDADVLRSTVTRICALQDMLASEDLRTLVARMKSLPALPALYNQLTEALQSPNASGKTVGRVIAKDVAMTAKVLQLVNSAFFGVQRSMSDPAEAVTRLGMNTIKNLVLSFGVFSRLEGPPLLNMQMERLWEHSLQVSLLARSLCRLEGSDIHTADDAATGGMLHDVGKVILAAEFATEYDRLLGQSPEAGLSTVELEQRALGCTHAQVGAYLLGIWGLPTTVVEAVAFHHDLRDYLADRFSAVLAVFAADVLVNEASGTGEVAAGLATLQELGFEERLPVWRRHMQATPEQAA